MQINRLSKALGAEVIGIDLNSIQDHEHGEINAAFLEYQLLVFRDQKLDPRAQIRFSKRFGPIETREGRPFTLPNYPEVTVLSNRLHEGEPVGVISAGDFWHTDLSFAKSPSRATFLHALEVAEEGGDTEWSDLYAAYDTLSNKLRKQIAGLKAIHVFDRRRNSRAQVDQQFSDLAEKVYGVAVPDAVHPVVRSHPITKRRALYISPRFVVGIVGMDDSIAQPLLDELFEHQIKPEFRYRHKWKKGDLLMWDNPCLIHIGRGGIKSPGIRHMHRTMVIGEQPF